MLISILGGLFVDEDEVGLVVLGIFDKGCKAGFVHVIYE